MRRLTVPYIVALAFVLTTTSIAGATVENRELSPPYGASWLSSHNVSPKPWASCSNSYLWYNTAGRIYGVSAGHCGGPGSRLWGAHVSGATTASFYGTVPAAGDTYDGSDNVVDAMRFDLDAVVADYPIGVAPSVLSGPATFRPVIGYHAHATQNLGDYICGAGLGTAKAPPAGAGLGEHCGTLEWKDIHVTRPDGVQLYVDCFRQHAYPADAGGPVYEQSNGNAVAYGITVGLFVLNGHEDWCYQGIDAVMPWMNLTLLTS